jgi:DedD protein
MDQALKQRLVGATVLIILAVILLPMLLSGQSELQNESRRIELPDKPPELSMDKRRFPIGQQDDSHSSRVPEPQPETQPETQPRSRPAEASAPARNASPGASAAAQEAVPTETNEETRPAQIPAAPAPAVEQPEGDQGQGAPAQGRYLVQVASFSNPASVNQFSQMLGQIGLPVLLDQVTTDAGRLHRVRVGPFDEVSQADTAIESIRALNLDLQPRMVDLYPEEEAPVTEPSDPMVRWVVQAGVFSARENAESMMQRLRNEGFSAFLQEESGGGKTVFRVKIGPVVERRHAEALDAQLLEKMGINGMVMSVD